jgi:hypothetical protein
MPNAAPENRPTFAGRILVVQRCHFGDAQGFFIVTVQRMIKSVEE